MIDASQEIITDGQSSRRGMSPPMKKHLELEIKTLENAPEGCRSAHKTFASKTKTKGGKYYAYRRHRKTSYRD